MHEYDNGQDTRMQRHRQLQDQDKDGKPKTQTDGSNIVLNSAPPIKTGFVHNVQAGESLWTIAEAHGTTVEELVRLNPQYADKPGLIHTGDIINLPKDSQKEGMITGDQLQLGGGKIEVVDYEASNERSSEDESFEGLNIDLKFVPDKNSKFNDVKNIGWFQTFRTNYETTSEKKPPESTEILDYVDGGVDPKQTAVYYNTDEFTLGDSPGRPSLKDRNVFWQAETSVVDRSGDKPVRLFTMIWGFELDTNGNVLQLIGLKAIDTPSDYHLQKLSELPTR